MQGRGGSTRGDNYRNERKKERKEEGRKVGRNLLKVSYRIFYYRIFLKYTHTYIYKKEFKCVTL